jgi:hypothetical protein
MGGFVGMQIGHNLHNAFSKNAAAELERVRQLAQSDPAYAGQLLQQYNSIPGWPSYLAQRTPWLSMLPPGGQSQ